MCHHHHLTMHHHFKMILVSKIYLHIIGDIIIRINSFLNSCLYSDGYGVPATPVIFLPDDPQISVVEDEVAVDDDNDDDDDDTPPVILDNVENFRLQHELLQLSPAAADGNQSLQDLVPGGDKVGADNTSVLYCTVLYCTAGSSSWGRYGWCRQYCW